MHAQQRVAELSRWQYGLVSSAQLAAAGVGPNAISAWASSGRLHRIHRGVYAVGHRALSREAHLLAAVLAVGRGAAVSHRSAGAVWDLLRDRGNRHRRVVDVITPRRVSRRPGITPHFAPRLHSRELMHWDRIPITTPARTLLDLAASLSEDRLRRVVRQAQADRLVVQYDLEEQLARVSAHTPGARRLAAVVAPGPTPTRSVMEDRMLDLLQRRGFPRPQPNVRIALPDRTVEVDFLYADRRLVLETDGDRFHGTRLAREADAARQAALETAGYRVVRLNWQQVDSEQDQTAARLRRIFGDETG